MTQFQRRRIQEEIDRQARIAEPNTLFNRLKHSEWFVELLVAIALTFVAFSLAYLFT